VSGILEKSVRDQKRALIGWGIGLLSVVLMYAAFFPSIKESAADLNAYMEKLPEAIRELFGGADYASPIGYLQGELFGSMGLILMLIFSIGAGARAIAGEEENRTLDVLLSTPVRRRQVLAAKAASMLGTVVALCALLFASVALFGPPFGLDVPLVNLAIACGMLALVGISFGAIALAIGAATGHRTTAIAATTGFAVFAYILNGLAMAVDEIEFLRPLSPFRWYMEPQLLESGGRVVNLLVFVGITAAGYAVALWGFERRDLAA
jgi:ABC-2 type transport system permease protein